MTTPRRHDGQSRGRKPLWLSAVLFVVGCAHGAPTGAGTPVQAPEGSTVTRELFARGVQIYLCAPAGAWQLKAPEAKLFADDKMSSLAVGTHQGGPSWTLTDGGRVKGDGARAVKYPAHAESIPWLLVPITEASGSLARVTYVQRLETRGGQAPTSGCDREHAGEELRVQYRARYVFLSPAR